MFVPTAQYHFSLPVTLHNKFVGIPEQALNALPSNNLALSPKHYNTYINFQISSCYTLPRVTFLTFSSTLYNSQDVSLASSSVRQNHVRLQLNSIHEVSVLLIAHRLIFQPICQDRF